MILTTRPRLHVLALRLLATRHLERRTRRAARHLAVLMLSGADAQTCDAAATALLNRCEDYLRAAA